MNMQMKIPDYPIGTQWLDMASKGDDDKVDYYLKTNDKWIFLKRDFALWIPLPDPPKEE